MPSRATPSQRRIPVSGSTKPWPAVRVDEALVGDLVVERAQAPANVLLVPLRDGARAHPVPLLQPSIRVDHQRRTAAARNRCSPGRSGIFDSAIRIGVAIRTKPATAIEPTTRSLRTGKVRRESRPRTTRNASQIGRVARAGLVDVEAQAGDDTAPEGRKRMVSSEGPRGAARARRSRRARPCSRASPAG